MNFVQQLEECLRDLASEARKKHPGVKEASERATLRLRTLKNSYVSAVRQATSSGADHPTTKLFQSSDLLHPFLLAANYPNATDSLLEISFRAMKLLMEADAVVPSDGLNMVRVWMIQAHVVTAYYQKQYAKELKSHHSDSSSEVALTKSTKPLAAASTGTGSSSSSSWFSWGSSSSTPVPVEQTTLHETPSKLSAKSAVSSSSGQTGQGSQSPALMEKLALEILSCLLQLLERLKSYPESLSFEIWTNATSLACLWLYNVPKGHKLQQAAQSTTVQVIELLYQSNGSAQRNFSNKLVSNTWEDLLALSTVTTKKINLSGAFSLCKRSQGTAAADPPMPEFALELMTQVWRNGRFRPEYELMIKTFSVTIGLLQQINKVNVEKGLRTFQWSSVLFLAQSGSFRNECRELFCHLMKPIVQGTDACRSHHDFEDGFVYDQREVLDNEPDSNRETKKKNEALASFFPPTLLWKAGFALESMYMILDRGVDELDILFEDEKIVSQLAEALSHFATIGASCRDHMLQVVDFCDSHQMNAKPAIIRKAEVALLNGNSAIFQSISHPRSKEKNSTSSAPILGESIFFAIQSMLRIASCLGDVKDPGRLLEETFAPFLAILQHYMKRFAGSPELVRMSLSGYSMLASVCLPQSRTPLQRRALLTSLSKLSLPSWGKHDPSSQLSAHHVRALVCLLKIVHIHFDFICEDWELILWTLEELSVMPIASCSLSDEDYHAALSIAAVFKRFTPFTTCFSDQSATQFVETLTNICESLLSYREIAGDSDMLLPDLSLPSESHEKQGPDERNGTIGGKLMSMGVKAIYGNSNNDEETKDDSSEAVQRSKQVFYEEHRKSFIARVTASKHSVRMDSLGRVPFVLSLLSDVVIANAFRPNECLQAFATQLSRLAASTPVVRPFVMDITTLLIMTQLSEDESLQFGVLRAGKVLFNDPMLSQLLATERIDDQAAVGQHASQVDVLRPLCETVRTGERADIVESAVSALYMVLQGSGHLFKSEVWSLILDTISSVSGDPQLNDARTEKVWADCSQSGFRSFKLIVDDFLDEQSAVQDARESVIEDAMECCCAFVRSHHDVNTSLTAIGLLWNIADQDTDSSSVDRALQKLVLLSSDPRAEVRNASVNTLFSCIVGRGNNFSPAEWKSCFIDTICGVHENVAEHFRFHDEEAKTSNEMDDEETKASVETAPGKRKKPVRYKVARHHSRDSAIKQWVATQVLVLRGLTRVLRAFFKEILDTVDPGSAIPGKSTWFENIWSRILDFATEAATQDGDRDSLDLRSVGVDLLGICCQLSSSAGIKAAVTPARVGTNMEVVNGALRSVRESASRPAIEHSHSTFTTGVKRMLFRDAFARLASFEEHIIRKAQESDFPDDIDLQLFQKYSMSLSKVYECCKYTELCPSENSMDSGLEARFVKIVSTVLVASTKSEHARYLNQSQRCCMDLLRTMASSGSVQSFVELIFQARGAFFVRRDQDTDESEHGEDAASVTYGLLCHESAAIVSEEITRDSISQRCSVLVLGKVLSVFYKEFGASAMDWKKRNYKHFIPLLDKGLKGVKEMDEDDTSVTVWTDLTEFLTKAFCLVELGRGLTKLPRVSELLEILEIAIPCVPANSKDATTDVLSLVAMRNALKSARQHSAFAIDQGSSDVAKKSKRHLDELMSLYGTSFRYCCQLSPESHSLRVVSREALSGLLTVSKVDPAVDPAVDTLVAASQVVCETILKYENMQTLVVALFPFLIQLMAYEDERLRRSAVGVFQAVDVALILDQSNERYQEAERRAESAEAQLRDVTSSLEALKRVNTKLRQEVAVLEASTVLPS